MAFAPKAGCPMCSIVASAVHAPSHSPRSPTFPAGSTAPEVLWRDDNFTIYRERAHPVSSKGHLVAVFNLHVPSLYTLSTSDLPLLVSLRDLSRRLLSSLLPSSSPLPSPSLQPQPATPISAATPNQLLPSQSSSQSAVPSDHFRIGFITPPFKDSKIPVTDHLHAHAYILPADLMGWWRSVGYSSIAWYDIDDLIAEIREESSNNRVRSGPSTRALPRPIDHVPAAGARTGLPNGVETTDTGLGALDLEDPEANPSRRNSYLSATDILSPTSSSTGTRPKSSSTLSPRSPSTSAYPPSPSSPSSSSSRRGTASRSTGLEVAVSSGGALVMSPSAMDDDRQTPTRNESGSELSPNSQIPDLRV
ncbi:hypothetical protein K474DRAFT_1663248 [Panus rudis PR-1116 ss-1]|nr:hypothetical protein K474DRAFT_1663248 [Panus rudis PR-1116 ss-1]